MLHLLQTRRLLAVGRFVESTLVPVLSAETLGFGMEHGCPDVVTVVMGMAKVVDRTQRWFYINTIASRETNQTEG